MECPWRGRASQTRRDLITQQVNAIGTAWLRLVLVSGLLAGFGMGKAEKQSPLHLFGFAAIMALSVYLILDLEYPRLGLVRIDSFDVAMTELRASMK